MSHVHVICFACSTCTLVQPIAVATVINMLRSGRRRREFVYQIKPPSHNIWYSSNWIGWYSHHLVYLTGETFCSSLYGTLHCFWQCLQSRIIYIVHLGICCALDMPLCRESAPTLYSNCTSVKSLCSIAHLLRCQVICQLSICAPCPVPHTLHNLLKEECTFFLFSHFNRRTSNSVYGAARQDPLTTSWYRPLWNFGNQSSKSVGHNFQKIYHVPCSTDAI